MTFPPSVPEFCAEVKRCQQTLDAKARPHVSVLPPPSHPSPYEIKVADAERRYAGRKVLAENMTLDEYRRACRVNNWPVGTNWVPVLNGRVYAPA